MDEKINLVDQMIIKCNDAVKTLTQGQYIAFCSQMVDLVRNLAVLRNMIVEDAKPEVENNERNDA